jgi:hypothetical protein
MHQINNLHFFANDEEYLQPLFDYYIKTQKKILQNQAVPTGEIF